MGLPKSGGGVERGVELSLSCEELYRQKKGTPLYRVASVLNVFEKQLKG